MMDLKYDTGKLSSKIKLSFLEKYFRGYFPKIINTYGFINIFDPFCGPGKYILDGKEEVYGSPLILLNYVLNYLESEQGKNAIIKNKHNKVIVNLFFNDKEKKYIKELVKNLNNIGILLGKGISDKGISDKGISDKVFKIDKGYYEVNIKISNMDYNNFKGKILFKHISYDKKYPSFIFFDPYNLEIPPEDIEDILNINKGNEILEFVPLQTVSRGANQGYGKIKEFRDIFLPNCMGETNPDKLKECIESFLKNNLFKKYGDLYFIKLINLQSGSNRYSLLHITNHMRSAQLAYKNIYKIIEDLTGRKTFDGYGIMEQRVSKIDTNNTLFGDELINWDFDSEIKQLIDQVKSFIFKSKGKKISNVDINRFILLLGYPIIPEISKEVKMLIDNLVKDGFIEIKKIKSSKYYGINDSSLIENKTIFIIKGYLKWQRVK